jgi:hypothetical protein
VCLFIKYPIILKSIEKTAQTSDKVLAIDEGEILSGFLFIFQNKNPGAIQKFMIKRKY